MATSQASFAPVTATSKELQNAAHEIAHLVCCRAASWTTAICGAEAGHMNLTAETACSMCVEEVLRRLPSALTNDPPVCPLDLRLCPDEHEIDLRILREVT